MRTRWLQRAIVMCLAVTLGGCADEKYVAMKMEGEMLGEQLSKASVAPARAAALAGTDEQPLKLSVDAQAQRLVIYSGLMGLVVSDIRQTLEQIRSRAVEAGGYLQEMDGTSITVRVPAGRFNEAVTFVATLGEVVQQHIKAQDVTEEMRDLRIRLDNAAQTRTRLLALLEKSQKMEDTLKIEAELERVTQTIELLKGKIQAIESQVAFSLLKVQLNSPLPQRQLVAQIPFEWVHRLGEGVTSGAAAQSAITSSRDRRALRFDPPKSYIRYYDRDRTSEAMSADGVLIKLQTHDNYQGGDLEFWGKLARRALVENRSVAFDRDETVTLASGATGRLMSGTRDLGGKKSDYLIGIVAARDEVYTFEAWGPREPFENDRPTIEASLKSLRADRW